MKTEDFLLLSFPQDQVLCYDDDAGDSGESNGDSGEGAGGGGGDNSKNEQTFTQAQLNEILAADRRKHQEKTQAVQAQAKQLEVRMEKLIADKNTSDAARASLEQDLEELRASQRTEAEQRQHLAEKAKVEHETAINNLKNESKQWESLYKISSIERTLTDAAVKHEAFSPGQLVSLLKDKTEMRPCKDQEGQVIPGRFEAKTAVEVKDEHGNILKHWKNPDEAVELMKQNANEYGNLFRNAVIAGIGAGTAASTGKNSVGVDRSKLSIEEKARRFREDPESLGLKAKRNY